MKNILTVVLLALDLPCAAQQNPGSLVPTTPSQAPDDEPVGLTPHLTGCMLIEAMCVLKTF